MRNVYNRYSDEIEIDLITDVYYQDPDPLLLHSFSDPDAAKAFLATKCTYTHYSEQSSSKFISVECYVIREIDCCECESIWGHTELVKDFYVEHRLYELCDDGVYRQHEDEEEE